MKHLFSVGPARETGNATTRLALPEYLDIDWSIREYAQTGVVITGSDTDQTMECPACHSNSQPGQKFCGACGSDLKKECPSCGTINPSTDSVCCLCGKRLAIGGTIALVRSGLIADSDQNAAVLLGRSKEQLAGRPFTLFVAREDLPIFFSHWNELINSGENQSAELALKHKSGKKKYVTMEWTLGEQTPGTMRYQLRLSPAGGYRSAMERLQRQQDLLNLIYSLADSVRTASERHQASAVVQGLKRICLFLKADHCFIYTIDRRRDGLQSSHQWSQPDGPDEKALARIVPLAAIRRSIARLRRERAYIIDNVSKLPAVERKGLLTAFRDPPASLMCQLIYTHKRPIAIIGAARKKSVGDWSSDGAALIKLFGQLVCDLPSLDPVEKQPISPDPTLSNHHRAGHAASTAMKNPGAAQSLEAPPVRPEKSDQGEIKSSQENLPRIDARPQPNMGDPMQLEKMAGIQSIARQRVFVREDGLILLSCPHCGMQESVTTARFENLGNAVTVLCACRNRFAAVLEKRGSVRKAVQLEGYFTIAGDYGPGDAKGNIWGPMVVKSLSKSGLRFTSPRVNLIEPGDLLMVRFNLNNSNKALIHKKAQVVSIRNIEVGCRFEGADEYDITLGFYFM